MISMTTRAAQARPRPLALYGAAVDRLGQVPESLLLLLLRIGVAMVFWKAGVLKLQSWDSTIFLFAEEYRVPLLSPEVAASLATAVELGGAVALIVGLATRLGALALLGLVAVIQLFVYPALWSDHIFWLAALLILLVRGAGAWSLDHLIARLTGLDQR
jgi:putative oxidoreductase